VPTAVRTGVRTTVQIVLGSPGLSRGVLRGCASQRPGSAAGRAADRPLKPMRCQAPEVKTRPRYLVIGDLDNPFGYYEKASSQDVSLKPLEDALERIDARAETRTWYARAKRRKRSIRCRHPRTPYSPLSKRNAPAGPPSSMHSEHPVDPIEPATRRQVPLFDTGPTGRAPGPPSKPAHRTWRRIRRYSRCPSGGP